MASPGVAYSEQPNATDEPFISGLQFDLAQNLEEVTRAWSLVYEAYLRASYVDPNRWKLHTVPEAVRPTTAVAVGQIQSVVASTISCYIDGPEGLPLDRVHRQELDAFRQTGRRLAEVGLFADRREKVGRSFNALMHLMRYAFHHAIHQGATDLVIGVNPHHARFYERLFDFERFADDSTCPAVNDAPMVPLRLDIPLKYEKPTKLPKGLAFFRANPVDTKVYAHRFDFSPAALAGSAIADYLAEKHAKTLDRPMSGC